MTVRFLHCHRQLAVCHRFLFWGKGLVFNGVYVRGWLKWESWISGAIFDGAEGGIKRLSNGKDSKMGIYTYFLL